MRMAANLNRNRRNARGSGCKVSSYCRISMIAVILHLLACIALATASLYWRYHAQEGESIQRHVMPFIVAAGSFGFLILCGYLMEFFVVTYSGAIYEVGGLTGWRIAWATVSACLTLLPLIGLVPSVGRRPYLLLMVACLAAVPSVVSLVSGSSNPRTEIGSWMTSSTSLHEVRGTGRLQFPAW